LFAGLTVRLARRKVLGQKDFQPLRQDAGARVNHEERLEAARAPAGLLGKFSGGTGPRVFALLEGPGREFNHFSPQRVAPVLFQEDASRLGKREDCHASAVADDLARRLASVGGADVMDLERDLSAGENLLAL